MNITDLVYEGARRAILRIGVPLPRLEHCIGTVADVPIEERAATPMHRAFYEANGQPVQKMRNYFGIYDCHLSRFRNTPVRFLEIGVWKGGSLEMWRRYLGPDAVLFGIDKDPACGAYDGKAGQIRIGSQEDPAFLREVVREMGGIDVVNDDGSHVARHQRTSFEVLFPLLSDRGVYICEDTHTAYWRGWPGGGYRRRTSFVEYAKRIVDDLHAESHGRRQTLERADRLVSGVHFYNGIVVFEKEPQPPLKHLLSGTASS